MVIRAYREKSHIIHTHILCNNNQQKRWAWMNLKESGKRYMGSLRVGKWREKCCNYIAFSKEVNKKVSKTSQYIQKTKFLHVCKYMYLYVWGHVWRPEDYLDFCSSDIVCLVFGGQSLSLVWELPSKWNCHLTLNHPPALAYPVLGLEGCTSMDSLLHMGFGPLFQVLSLVMKIVYCLSFLSRPLNHI